MIFQPLNWFFHAIWLSCWRTLNLGLQRLWLFHPNCYSCINSIMFCENTLHIIIQRKTLAEQLLIPEHGINAKVIKRRKFDIAYMVCNTWSWRYWNVSMKHVKLSLYSLSDTVHVIIKLEKSHQGNLRGTVDKLHYSLLVRTALIHKVSNDILSKPLKSGTVSRLIWNLAPQVQFRNIALQVDCLKQNFEKWRRWSPAVLLSYYKA